VDVNNREAVSASLSTYRTDLETIIFKVKKEATEYNLNVTIALCTPTLIGDRYDGTNDRDDLLEEASAVAQRVAMETESVSIDLRLHFLNYLETFNHENLNHSTLTYDGIHMNEAGHMLTAAIFLQEMGFNNRHLLDDPKLDLSITRNRYKGRREEL
jgi:lysophospholipase L1-like esterase